MITPHGGELVDRRVGAEEWRKRLDSAGGRSLRLTPGDLINLYNVATGGYSPLTGFMTEAEYRQVLASSKLPSGAAWTVPILLQIEESAARGLAKGSSVALLDPAGATAGVLEVESVFKLDRVAHEQGVFGTTSDAHPGVRASRAKPDWCAGGTIAAPPSGTAGRYARDPKALRSFLQGTGRKTFTAFSTRNIGHIGHEHLHRLALERTDMLGILVITGAQVKGSMLPEVIYEAYERLIEAHYPAGRVLLNELRLPPIYAGPKEAFLQAILVQNHGFTHFIVGRDHAGCGDFYSRYASQRIFKDLGGLALDIMAIPEPRWCKSCAKVTTEGSCPHDGDDVAALNGRDVRRLLVEGREAELKGLLSADVLELLTGRLKASRTLFFE